ncbi:quinone oxidoreductase family protein [Blastococcus haudaquaticus]|uniref:NADPH:quinone reductase n=1 Tax=Blastococcus haudaquaticus TaxID=1938745 RepID=A0A286GR72_9ACTN|nr:NADP-dependent oxidoreductase [Blastococcus haudaquaticus]SOD98055.1 NADPH:quinone reductase [Blastococcus haudaquaticus]
MRAYVLPTEGVAPVFSDVPPPEPADGEVLVRVTASSVNPHDAMVASGGAARYMTYHYPVVLGSDFAGTVEALGAGVDDLAVGRRVFGLVRELVAARGSFGELVAVPRDWVVPVPDGVEDAAAGALGLAALTALRCVEAVAPAPGEVVLVNGATGGVGSYAVQMLVARGATVVATARPGEEERHVRDMGATDVVDWSAGDLAERVRSLHPDGVAAIVDLVNRNTDTFTALATRVLARGGRVACTGHAADPDRLPGVRATNVRAEVDQDALRTIADLVGAGRLHAPITATFPFDEVATAFETLRTGAVGKLAIEQTTSSAPLPEQRTT